MVTGDVVYSLRFSQIKILPEPGFDLGSTAGESCVLNARLHMLSNPTHREKISISIPPEKSQPLPKKSQPLSNKS